MYQALKGYEEAAAFTPCGKCPTSEFFLTKFYVAPFYLLFITMSPYNRNVVISFKLFTVCSNELLSNLNSEENHPRYRASATRAIQSSALYLKYRFQIYDTPWWKFTFGMIGFFSHGSLY